jgi:hypothetical protein
MDIPFICSLLLTFLVLSWAKFDWLETPNTINYTQGLVLAPGYLKLGLGQPRRLLGPAGSLFQD